jgi:uncharacterized integral membrane protein
MAAIRFFLLLVLLGGLTVLLVQNWTPVLPLVFLGGQTQALPLSIWILFGVAAGAITSIFIASCFQISSYFAQPRAKKPRRRAAKTAATRSTPEEKNTSQASDTTRTSSYSYTAANATPRQTPTSVQDDSNDWETSADDDWDFAEDTAAKSDRDPERREYTDRSVADRTRSSDPGDDWEYIPQQEPQPQVTIKNSTSYESDNETEKEIDQEPKSSDRPDSVYSYSSREPKNSGVGRTESIYDAEYRVLTPPYKQQNPSPPPPPNNRPQNNDDDDWGFMDDEDWDAGDDSPRPAK